MSQRDKVLQTLDKYGSITALDAMTDFGIMRLSARIGELKEEGYNIASNIESGVNRWGDKIKYARYSWEESKG